jgi:hypothetical protein
MESILIIYGISALAIILGFIALLTQKIYMDAKTQKATQIKIPIVGRMRTNYPALVFVFVGFALSVIAANKTPEEIEVYKAPPKKEWKVTGSFKIRDEENIDYGTGTLAVFPSDFEIEVNKNGRFNIIAKIEEGKTFEEEIERMDYTHTRGSIEIIPKDEYTRYKKQDPASYLESATGHTRKYQTIFITPKDY